MVEEAVNKEPPTILIKIYSGPHVGAEFRLGIGSYVLGCAPACDIIFHDEAVAERHLQLTLTETGVTVYPLAIPVYCGGQEVTQAAITVHWHQVITVGTTHFCCGRSEADWPIIQLPPPATARPAVARDDVGPDDEVTAADRSSGSIGSDRTRLVCWPYGWRSGVSLLLVGGLLAFGISKASTHLPITQPSATEQVSQIIGRLGFDHLQVIGKPDEGILIQGYVAKTTQKRELQAALQTIALPISQRVWASDELVSSTRAVLDTLGMGQLQVSTGQPGELLLRGYVADAAAWRTTLAALHQDIPGIRAIDHSGVETATQRAEALHALLQQHGLDSKLGVTVKPDLLLITGALSRQELQAWAGVQDMFRQRYDQHPPLETRIQEIGDAIELAVKSVSVGPTAFLVTREGGKYLEGAQLANGYVIKAIKSDRIVLTRNNRDYSYYLESK